MSDSPPSSEDLWRGALKGTQFEDDEELIGCFAMLDPVVNKFVKESWQELKNFFQPLGKKIQDKGGVMDAVKVLFRYAKLKAEQLSSFVGETAQNIKKTVEESRLLQFVLLVIFLALLAYFVGPLVWPYVQEFAIWIFNQVMIIKEFICVNAQAAYQWASTNAQAAYQWASTNAQSAYQWASPYVKAAYKGVSRAMDFLMWAIETAIEAGVWAMNISYKTFKVVLPFAIGHFSYKTFMTVKDFAIEKYPIVKEYLIELAAKKMEEGEEFVRGVITIMRDLVLVKQVQIVLACFILPYVGTDAYAYS